MRVKLIQKRIRTQTGIHLAILLHSRCLSSMVWCCKVSLVFVLGSLGSLSNENYQVENNLGHETEENSLHCRLFKNEAASYILKVLKNLIFLRERGSMRKSAKSVPLISSFQLLWLKQKYIVVIETKIIYLVCTRTDCPRRWYLRQDLSW